ncbi:MAG: O-antigen ligase family protein [Bacteroidia bacterium]
MKDFKAATAIYATGLAITPVIVSPFVLDFTLTARFISLSAFLLLSLYFLYRSKTVLVFKTDPIILSYLGYVFFCLLSLLWAHTLSEAIFDVSKLILGFSVFWFTAFILKKQPDNFNSFLLKFPVIVLVIGLITALMQISQLPDFKKDSIYAVTGMNGHKNLYSSFLFLNLFFLARSFFKSGKTWKILSAIGIVLTLVLIVFIRTKAVWIGISVTVFSAILFYFLSLKKLPTIRMYIWLPLLLIATNTFFIFGLPPIVNKTINSNAAIILQKPEERQKAELDNERLLLWNKTYGVLKKHLFVGTGMGNWQISFPDETLTGLWRAEDLNYTFQRPHNDLLWILSETGLIGFNLYLLFLFLLLGFVFKVAKKYADNKPVQKELALCFGFIIGYTAISFFDFPKERIEHTAWINIIAGIAYFNISSSPSFISVRQYSLKPVLPGGLIILLFIVVVGILRYKGEYYTRKMYDLKRMNNYTEVIKNGNKALSFAYTMDPTSIPISWFTGNARAALQDYKKAQEDLKRAYELNPYNRNVINDLASSYALTGNVEMAKKLYIETSRISPRFDEPKLNLVALYLQEQKYREAAECLKTIYHDSERRSNYQRMVDTFFPKKP